MRLPWWDYFTSGSTLTVAVTVGVLQCDLDCSCVLDGCLEGCEEDPIQITFSNDPANGWRGLSWKQGWNIHDLTSLTTCICGLRSKRSAITDRPMLVIPAGRSIFVRCGGTRAGQGGANSKPQPIHQVNGLLKNKADAHALDHKHVSVVGFPLAVLGIPSIS